MPIFEMQQSQCHMHISCSTIHVKKHLDTIHVSLLRNHRMAEYKIKNNRHRDINKQK